MADSKVLPPGAWLGVLGGGQLGRMFCLAAHTLGYRVLVLDPDESSPAGACADDQIIASYADARALAELADRCEAITTEFENVPAESLRWLARHRSVSPSADSVSIAQDRRREKQFIQNAGIAVAEHAPVLSKADLERASADLFPGILKTASFGYDGKGQAVVADRDQALAAYGLMNNAPAVLEKKLDLACELSVVLARGFDARMAAYPVCENVHRNGILARTVVPARVSVTMSAQAIAIAQHIAEALDYVGVLCVEFFVLRDARLVVNEIAPRPHNSGHYTIDACVTSQFEQQVRVLARMPLGTTRLRSAAVMINLLGDLWYPNKDSDAQREPDWVSVLGNPNAKLHLYGKRDARRARKMGHLTVCGDSLGEACAQASLIEFQLGMSTSDV